MRWLSEYKIPTHIIPAVLESFGKNALYTISQNPYLLTRIAGISFVNVDSIARGTGVEVGDTARMESLLYSIMSNAVSEGHLAIPLERLYIEVGKEFDRTGENRDRLHQIILKNEDFTTYRPKRETNKMNTLIYFSYIFTAEKYIAESLAGRARANHNRIVADDAVNSFIRERENEQGFKFDEEQKVAIANAMRLRVSMFVGGGGCGKHTIIGAINALAQKHGLIVSNLAGTPTSAKLLSEQIGAPAISITSALGISMEDNPYNIEPNQIPGNIVIIEDMGAVDNATMFQLMRALADNQSSHIVLVGDTQRSKIGMGTTFSDIVRSGVIPSVSFTKIHSDDGNMIQSFAQELYEGKIPADMPIKTKVDRADFHEYRRMGVILHERESETDTLETIQKLVHMFVSERGMNPKDIQAYSAQYNSHKLTAEQNEIVGTAAVNKSLQEYLIQKKVVDGGQCMLYGGKKFCVGDRIFRVHSHGSSSSGEIGYITHIDNENFEIEVDFG